MFSCRSLYASPEDGDAWLLWESILRSVRYHRSKINVTPKGVHLPISKLHSILAVANLLAHNNKSQICYCGQISLQSAAVNCSFSYTFGGINDFAGTVVLTRWRKILASASTLFVEKTIHSTQTFSHHLLFPLRCYNSKRPKKSLHNKGIQQSILIILWISLLIVRECIETITSQTQEKQHSKHTGTTLTDILKQHWKHTATTLKDIFETYWNNT